MYKNFIAIIIITFLSVTYCQAQTITIDEFKNDTISKFDNNGLITAQSLKAGIILRLKKSSGLTKAFGADSHGAFVDGIFPPSTSSNDFISYNGIKIDPIPSDSLIKIKIFDTNDSTRIIILNIQPDNQNPLSNPTPNNDCTDIVFTEGNDNCITPDQSNNYGLDPGDFEKSDVIYVYDFNKITTKRRFYKITKDETSLHTNRINLTKETLKPNKQVWIKLNNVNRFMYDASVEDTLVDYYSEPSALFNRMFLGDSSSLLGTLMNNFATKAQSNDQLEETRKDINCFYVMFTKLQTEMIKAYNPCETFYCCNKFNFNLIISKLNQVNTNITQLQIDSILDKSRLQQLKEQLDLCNKKDSISKSLKARIAELEKIQKPTDEQTKELNQKKEELNKFVTCTGDEVKNINNNISDLETELATITILTQLQSHLPKADELRTLSVFLLHINEQNQNLIKGPIQLKGNRLDFTLHITSIDSINKRFGYPSFKDSLHYEIPIILNSFVSFSSGSFVAFGKNLQNKTYTWRPLTINNVIDSSKATLVENGYTPQPAGFSAFGNIEWKATQNLGFGASVGVGLTIESNPRLSYLGGGSLFLGDLRQFAITFGVAGMQINKLTNNFQNIADNQTIYNPKTNIEYDKQFKIGAFLSLSYTPFATRKSK